MDPMSAKNARQVRSAVALDRSLVSSLTPNFCGNVTERMQASKSPDCFLNYY